jgi:hypothetical protein
MASPLHPTHRMKRLSATLCALALVSLSGCGREASSTYEAPRDPAVKPAGQAPAAPAAPVAMPAAPAPTDMASTPVATAPAGRFAWTVPASWRPGRVSSMRVASFVAGPDGSAADFAITTFPGDVGGDLANVNRWRGQIGLAAVSSLEGLFSPIQIAGQEGKFTHLKGASASTLAAWVRAGEATWFFKMTGEPAVIEAEKATFMEFMASVRAAEKAP